MKLSKKSISLICLSILVSIATSSESNIKDKLNLSSVKNANEITIPLTENEEIINNEDVVAREEETTDKALIENEISNNIQDEYNTQNNVSEDIKQEVVYLRNDMTTVSGVTKEELQEVLLTYKGASTMSHLAHAFVDAEKEYGVNAFAMAGIVALESGFATSRRAVEDNNLTGYEVYSDDSEGRLFKTQYDSIVQTAKHLSKNYLKEDGAYYNGLSVDAVQKSYCPDKKHNWHNKVDMLASGFLKVYNDINNE